LIYFPLGEIVSAPNPALSNAPLTPTILLELLFFIKTVATVVNAPIVTEATVRFLVFLLLISLR